MNKKKIIIISIVILIATSLIGVYLFLKPIQTKNISKDSNPVKKEETTNNDKEIIKFLKSITGLKAKNVELIDNPVGLKGEFLAPRESILRGVDYFLKDTKNDKMEDIKIDINEGYIKITTNYKVNSFISTPIEMKVVPSLDSNKNLDIKIDEVKFLDLKLAGWIVDFAVENFVKDWFPEDGDIKVSFNEGSVVIYKEVFHKGSTRWHSHQQ